MEVKAGSNELYHTLERLVALHRSLVDLLREEYAQLGAADVKSMAETAHAKEVLLSEIWNLEQIRIKSAEKLAASLGLPQAEVTLLVLAAAMPAAEGEKLRAIRTALNMLVAQAKELNGRNMEFAQSSLGLIEELKRNALGLTHTARKENYSNSGARQPIAEQGGRLLSTEA